MPRFLIAAAHKSSGKTVITTGLAAAFAARGTKVQTFKKGPDYIDPMWLSAASGRPCYNLDFNTMSGDELGQLFTSRHRDNSDLSLIEANKGLYDGLDLHGADSNAELAKILGAPVVLVVDTSGMTRGIAPLLLGYCAFDRDVNISGVILNKTGGARHEAKLRAATETYTDLPILGAISRTSALDIGERHLGLTTPAETGELAQKIAEFGRIISDSVDLDHLESVARSAPVLKGKRTKTSAHPTCDIRIGIAQDRAFGFYYADDLEAFAEAGATLVPFNTLTATTLPDMDGLFIGGGFPEMQMHALAANKPLRASIKLAIQNGLPTYAECGGLMYLCRSLSWQGARAEMVGVLPGDALMHPRPQGRGYTKYQPTSAHLWGEKTGEIPAHEFHYASIENLPDHMIYARHMTRGAGISGSKDGLLVHNLLAGFCHLRNSPSNPWVAQFADFVRQNKRQQKNPTDLAGL